METETNMVEVRYLGPHDAVEVRPWHDPDGGRTVVRRGRTLRTSAEHAAALALSGDWRLVAPKRRAPARKPGPKAL